MMYKLEYSNYYIPYRWYNSNSLQSSEILTKCVNSHQHISQAQKDLFPFPIVFDCRDEKNEKIYLHVHGLRKTFYLMFKTVDQITWRTSNISEFIRELYKKTKINILDAKIVHKTPLKKACMGSRFFIKCYVGKYTNFKKLKEYLKSQSTFDHEIYNKNITAHNEWIIQKDACTLGNLYIPEDSIVRDPIFPNVHVYHQDIILETNNEYHLDIKKSRILFNFISTEIIGKIINTQRFYSKNTNKLLEKISWNIFLELIDTAEEDIVWTWKLVKKCFLHYLFKNIGQQKLNKNIIYQHDANFDSIVLKALYLLQLEKPSNEDLQLVFNDLIILQGTLRRKLKEFWNKYKKETPDYKARVKKKEEMHTMIAKKLPCLVFDIETDFEKHMKKEDMVTCIACTLFDHTRDVSVLEHKIFLRAPPESDSSSLQENLNTNIDKITKICFDELKDNKNQTEFNFNKSAIDVKVFKEELAMIKDFLYYVCVKQVKFIAGFNSNKFDIPFLENRLAQLNGKELKNSKPTHIENLKFTSQDDKGYIRYRYKKNSSKKVKKNTGNQTEEVWNDKSVKTTSSSFLTACRDIMSINMETIILADIMLLVGDRDRGCKLDDVCFETFGVSKVKDDRVSYENICSTWSSGTLENLSVLLGYCLRDVVLLYMLAKAKGIMLFNSSQSIETGLQIRELFCNESVKTVSSLFLKYGYTQDILINETTPNTFDGTEIGKLNISFDPQTDFNRLKSLGGRSVQQVGWFDAWVVTNDFSSQYPSIMIGRNICLSSILDKEFIVEKNLVKDRDYFQITVPNLYASDKCIKCSKNGKLHNCKQEPQKCSFKNIPIYHDMYFATSSWYKGLSNSASVDFKMKRNEQKNIATTTSNSAIATQANFRQLALKTLGNSIYGVVLKIDVRIGGAVTWCARHDIGEVARVAKETFGYPVVTGDTDSVFLILLQKKDVADFSTMRKALGISEPCNVKDITLSLYEKAEEFVKCVNEGCEKIGLHPLYPSPSKLCVEKIFPNIFILAKKHYIGYKVMPNSLSLKFHMSGVSGKKADATKIKTVSQELIYKMMQRKDLKGLCLFMEHLFLFVSRELHADNIIENQKEQFEQAQNYTALKKYLETAEIHRRQHQGGNIPLDLLTSFQKVGDLVKMNTITSKKAKVFCFENGIDLHMAPMFLSMRRSSKSQVTGFLKSVILVLLSGPIVNKEYLWLDDRKKKVWEKYQKDLPDNHQLNDKMENLNRLTITTMPQKYISKKTDRASIDQEIYARLVDMLILMHDDEHQLQKYRNAATKSSGAVPHPPLPRLFWKENEKEKEQAISRLLHFLTGDVGIDVHPPPYMFDCSFAISKLSEMKASENHHHIYTTQNGKKSLLLWYLYIDFLELIQEDKQFLIIGMSDKEVVQIEFTNETPPHNCEIFDCEKNSLITTNVKCLKENIPQQYFLDMHFYRCQTMSTPVIIESYCSTKVYLTNNDSFRSCEKNVFSFCIKMREIINVFPKRIFETFKECDMITLQPCCNQKKISISWKDYESKIPIITLLRDDNCKPMTKWLWELQPIYVRGQTFFNTLWYKFLRTQEINFINFKCDIGKKIMNIFTKKQSCNISLSNKIEVLPPKESNVIEMMMNPHVRKRTQEMLEYQNKKRRK